MPPEADRWTTNLVRPGHADAARSEGFAQVLIPRMVAAVARGDTSPAEAVRAGEVRITPIFDQRREQGKV
jgi:hypothetical protein